MVYRGKPSAACERCRFRRLKCDYGSPSCAQCMRAGVNCPGYRNPLDLNFKDQSKEVIRNCQISTRKKRPVATKLATSVKSDSIGLPGIPGDPEESGVSCHNKAALTITRNSFTLPMQEIARSYLYVNYMTGGPRCGHMSYLLPLIDGSQNSAVNAAVNAVALAALSNIRMSPKAMLQAQQEYTTALSKTNVALRDPVMCKTDDVLAAVVMLGIFEVMTCTDGSFIDRWVNHMDGATRLIEVRGSEQLVRQEGLDMFTQLRSQVTLSRIYQERYSSPIFTKLTKEAQRDRTPDDQILDKLSTVVIRLTDFCADVKNRHIVDPCEIIRTALNIDAELVSLLISVPPLWGYTTVKVPMIDGKPITQAVWGDRYHIYHSISASSMWNNYRSARIIIQEQIINTVRDLENFGHNDVGSPQRNSLSSQARQTALQLVEDICASVPYNLGMEIEDFGHFDSPDLEAMDACDGNRLDSERLSFSGATLPWEPISPNTSYKGSLPPVSLLSHPSKTDGTGQRRTCLPLITPSSFQVTGAGGLTTMWPLLVAANSGVACGDLRKWITNSLDKIGHSMGINQALAMSKLIRDGVRSRAFLSHEYQSQPYNL